jgi:hypothetical protein
MTSRTFTGVIAAPAVGLPAYLQGVSSLQWVAVASQASEKIAAQAQSPMPGRTLSGVGWASGDYDAWAGAVVDQSRKEMIRPAGGGHLDGSDNSAFGINLGLDAPRWRRLTAPSPDSVFQASRTRAQPTAPNADRYTDGLPPAMHHGSDMQFQNGRVWWTQQTSVSGEGTSATSSSGFNGNWVIPACMSLDRDAIGSGPITESDSRFPLSYAATAPAWRQHGRTSQFWVNQLGGFGCSAALPSRDLVYGFLPTAADTDEYGIVNTATGATEDTRASYTTANVALISPAWAVGCDDLDIVIVGRAGTATIRVLIASTGVWHTVSVPNSYRWNEYDAATEGLFTGGYNPVYHEASHSILFYDWNQSSSGKIRQLKIPTSGGAYNQGWTWTWAELTTTNFTTNGTGAQIGGKNTYGKFNLIEDIGNGEPVLVLHPRIDLPVYVCRIGSIS